MGAVMTAQDAENAAARRRLKRLQKPSFRCCCSSREVGDFKAVVVGLLDSHAWAITSAAMPTTRAVIDLVRIGCVFKPREYALYHKAMVLAVVGRGAEVGFAAVTEEAAAETDVGCEIMFVDCVPLVLMKRRARRKVDMMAFGEGFGIMVGHDVKMPEWQWGDGDRFAWWRFSTELGSECYLFRGRK